MGRVTDYPARPKGWSTVGRRTVGPFTVGMSYRRPDGRIVRWSSRAHRKHFSRLSRPAALHEGVLWAPHRASWWIGVLFAIGSLCFLIAPLPAFVRLVGEQADGAVFFVGSLFFTSAAALQWLETINADAGPGAGHKRRIRLVTWEPRRVDWWSSVVQLLGTLFFNVTTLRALTTAVSSSSYNQHVWRPDLFGSVCFLVSGYLAYVEVTGGLLRRRPRRTLETGIVGVNLLGCVCFMVAGVASYVIPSSTGVVSVTAVNVGTSLGALCFLVGAVLLLPEGARDTSSTQ
jgi:hypothetical protein